MQQHLMQQDMHYVNVAQGLAFCGQAPASYASGLQVEVMRMQAQTQAQLLAQHEAQARVSSCLSGA